MRRSVNILYRAIWLLLLPLVACEPSTHSPSVAHYVARVGDDYLTTSDLQQYLPSGLSPEDSLAYVENYADEWVKSRLLYHEAEEQVDLKPIEQRVAEYREQLVVHAYKTELLDNRYVKQLSDSVLHHFYTDHASHFLLKRHIIQGLFIKVPEDAPQLKELKRWYRSQKPADIESIEKSTMQNVLIYEYFYDKWVNLDEVMKNIPYPVTNATTFLQQNNHLAVNHEGYWYLLNISNYLLKGGQQPFEYARVQIAEMLNAEQRNYYLEQEQERLLQAAQARGEVEFNHHPQPESDRND